MDNNYESPFLDEDMPWFTPEHEQAEPIAELESPYAQEFEDDELPFLNGESLNASYSEAEFEADPSLFDPADLTREVDDQESPSWSSEASQNSSSVSDEMRTFVEPQPFGEAFWNSQQESRDDGNDNESPAEVVYIKGEREWANENENFERGDEGEVVMMNDSEEWQQSEGESGVPVTPVRARILWPALGFPAVIAPAPNSNAGASAKSNATQVITVLLLSDRKNLSKAEAAKYLRIVPWKDRCKRHIRAGDTGSFRETDLVVRNDESRPMIVSQSQTNPSREQILHFGADEHGNMGIAVALSAEVRRLYGSYGLKYLHEIRVSEEICASLASSPEPYHLFWNNNSANENAPSDEMAMLLQRFAKPRRQAEGAQWQKVLPQLLLEYENEYGTMHLPNAPKPTKRAEILHPVFVRREKFANLRIGHVTDLHVDVRNDVYEFNLKKNPPAVSPAPVYNNWNTSAANNYAAARQDADIVLLTGDLIDYGRGHFGITARDKLGDNNYYHRDRNWFLFYDFLAASDRYTRPAYTSLGNHDWRLNPYPPFAVAGSPSTPNFFHNYTSFSEDQRKSFLRTAHGPGHEQSVSYDPKWQSFDVVSVVKKIPLLVKGSVTLDEPGLPTHTHIDSVIWYLLQINPFLDYTWSLPGNYRLLMLDWAEDEVVLFPIFNLGRPFTIKTSKADFDAASDPGPKAKNCLTPSQKLLVQSLIADASPAKVIGIHAPPIGPYGDWNDEELARGIKSYANRGVARGPMDYGVRKNGVETSYHGHPMFATQPPGDRGGMVADYGSFLREREWFVKALADQKSRVRLVFAGHIHRSGLFGVRIGLQNEGLVKGQYLIASLKSADVTGRHGPALAPEKGGFRAPLYVNTTTAGLRGNFNPGAGKATQKINPGYAVAELTANGTINGVSFRQAVRAQVSKIPPARSVPEVAAWG